jgi:hypothetical protein
MYMKELSFDELEPGTEYYVQLIDKRPGTSGKAVGRFKELVYTRDIDEESNVLTSPRETIRSISDAYLIDVRMGAVHGRRFSRMTNTKCHENVYAVFTDLRSLPGAKLDVGFGLGINELPTCGIKVFEKTREKIEKKHKKDLEIKALEEYLTDVQGYSPVAKSMARKYMGSPKISPEAAPPVRRTRRTIEPLPPQLVPQPPSPSPPRLLRGISRSPQQTRRRSRSRSPQQRGRRSRSRSPQQTRRRSRSRSPQQTRRRSRRTAEPSRPRSPPLGGKRKSSRRT